MRLTRSIPTPPTADLSSSPPRPGSRRPARSGVTRTGSPAVVMVTVAAVCAVVLVAAATPAQAADGGTQVLAVAASVGQVLTNLRNWLMGILAGLATVFLTVGGVRYLMAGGDPGEVEAAKRAFKSAGWGYVGAALAPLIVTILAGIVGA